MMRPIPLAAALGLAAVAATLVGFDDPEVVPVTVESGVALSGLLVAGTTDIPVEHAAVRIEGRDMGARTNREGAFIIFGAPDASDRPLRLVIEHPCFHRVTIELSQSDDTYVAAGLPLDLPRGPDGAPMPGSCSAYAER